MARGLIADRIQAERLHQPDRLAMHEAAHVLAADERDVVAEFLVKQLDQAAAMAGFLFAHAFEDRGGGGKVLAQALGVIGVDALVFFFERNGQGQDLAFRQAVEAAHTFSMTLGRTRSDGYARSRMKNQTTPVTSNSDAATGTARRMDGEPRQPCQERRRTAYQ